MASNALVPANQVQEDIKLLDFIGKGSFGVVRKAMINGHLCAVKELQQPIQEVAYEKFLEECKIMNSIKHDNIVLCLRVRMLNNLFPCPVLVMELMDCNLRQYLELSPIRYSIQIEIAENILQAIAYLHKFGIIHRDLSSGNVLMKGNIAKVTDFGMARLFPAVDMTKCPGTDVYMPPEAHEDPPNYDHTIDVFSAGVLMIQIQTRKVPNPDPNLLILDPVSQHVKRLSEIERRASHIQECDQDHPLLRVALCCIVDKKENRPSADRLCEEMIKIKTFSKFIQDKCVSDHNVQLSRQIDMPNILELCKNQSQIISQQGLELKAAQQTVSTLQVQNKQIEHYSQQQIQQLQSQVAQLEKVKEVGEHEIVRLHSQMTQLEKSKTAEIHQLQSRVDNLELHKQQVQQQMQQQMQEFQQKVVDFVQQIQSKSNEEKQHLEAEKEQISQQAKENESVLKGKITELELSLSELSMASSLSLHDSRSDSRLSFHEKSLNFVPGEDAPRGMHAWSSAVVDGNAIYLTPGRTKVILKYQNSSWVRFAECQAEDSALAFVDGHLVTIGGHFYYGDVVHYIGTLYSMLSDGSWEEALPPMNKERDSVIAITSGKALIVAGGRCKKLVVPPTGSGRAASSKKHVKQEDQALGTVEILSMETRVWQVASNLPFPLCRASVTICGDSLYIIGGQTQLGYRATGQKSVLTCKVADLILSRESAQSITWNSLCDVPVLRSTCVTLLGHLLLAIGGVLDNNTPSNQVYCYDEELKSWTVLGQLLMPREQCFAAVLSNRLHVIGGKADRGSLHSSMEIGTMSWS